MSNPGFVERGRQLVQRGEFEQAINVCRLGLVLYKTSVAGRLVLASALMALGRYDEVLAEVRVALDADNQNAEAMALRGEALLCKGDAQQARDVLREVLALEPGDARVEALVATATERLASLRASSAHDPPGAPTSPHLGSPATRSDSEFDSARAELRSTLGQVEPETVVDRPVPGLSLRRPVSVSEEEATDRDVAAAHAVAASLGANDAAAAGTRGWREPLLVSETKPSGQSPPPARRPEAGNEVPGAPGWELGRLFGDEPAGEARGAKERGSAGRRSSAPALASSWDAARESPARQDAAEKPATAKGAPRYGPERPRGEPAFVSSPHAGVGPADGRSREASWARASRRPLRHRVPSAGPGPPRRRLPRLPSLPRLAPLPDVLDWFRSRTRAGGFRLSRRVGRTALVLFTAVVLGTAVWAGLRMRALRLDLQIEAAQYEAAEREKTDTYGGYRAAERARRQIVAVRDSAAARAALARIVAALAAEFGAGGGDARELVASLGEDRALDALAARGYWAVARSDTAAAARIGAEIATRYPDAAMGPYFLGHAALLAGDALAAVKAFRSAERREQRPAIYLGIAAAEAQRRRVAEALAALNRANDLVPDHVGAIIQRARVLARAGSSGRRHRAVQEQLADLVAAGPGDRVAPHEVAWAVLALAELHLAQRETGRALAELEKLGATRPLDSWPFARAYTELLLRLGQLEAAAAEAKRAAALWSQQGKAHVLAAEVAVARGDAKYGLAQLQRAGDISEDPSALVAKGRAHLALYELAPARAALDRALRLRPDLREAQLARADLWLRSGEPRAAVRQLRKLYRSEATAEVALRYAAALRASGRRRPARRVLTKLLGRDKSGAAYLALARLEREQGRLSLATRAYQRAIEHEPSAIDVRLEAARFAFDAGETSAATRAVEELVAKAGDQPRVLVEAARIWTLTYAPERAMELLARAAELPSAPAGPIARERGRAHLAQRRPAQAVEQLERAVREDRDDVEGRLLLIDAHLAREDGGGVAAAQAAAKELSGVGAASHLARGRVALFAEQFEEAIRAFRDAHAALVRARALPRRRAEAAMWLGRAKYYQGNRKHARVQLQRALRLDPNHSEAHFFLGLVELGDARWKAALAAFSRAVKLNPHVQPRAWFYLGQAAEGAGLSKQAEEAYREFLQRVPEGKDTKEARGRLTKMGKAER